MVGGCVVGRMFFLIGEWFFVGGRWCVFNGMGRREKIVRGGWFFGRDLNF